MADNDGWAYASIVRNVGGRLAQYDHVVVYLLQRTIDPAEFKEEISKADVIVVMYLGYLGLVPEAMRPKVALMLTGFRALRGQE